VIIRDVGYYQAVDDSAERELSVAKAERARRVVPVAV
jgi:hypothetical protein